MLAALRSGFDRKSWVALGALVCASAVLSRWTISSEDPRDAALVANLVRKSESDSFRERLRRGDDDAFPWPGLSAVQASVIWLEMLNGLDDPASYEGDFSWIFSKLNSVLRVARPEELDFIATLAPFYFVIGHDGAGATLIMNEMLRRAPEGVWRPWFWGGFHALDNLGDRRLAGYLFGRAAESKQSPPWLVPLSLRLTRGLSWLDDRSKGKLLEDELPEPLLEKVKASRPEWFR